jgi:parallel beta-helix repeat protein
MNAVRIPAGWEAMGRQKQWPFGGWCFVPFVLLCLCGLAECAEEVNFYVAPGGNDAWTGSLPEPNAAKTDGPFATPGRARDAVRKARQASHVPVTVWLRRGTYPIAGTLKFTTADSGSAEAPVTYRAYRTEKPVLIGGRTISNWKPWKGKILTADLSPHGFAGKTFKLLLCGGELQQLARYPNFDAENPYGGGWAYVDGKPIPMYQNIEGESRREFICRSEDLRKWARPEDVEVFVFPRYNWWNNIVRIKSLDPATRRIELVGDCSYPIRPGDRYYFQNALEELDAPGEWYFDSKAGALYFWPPDGADANTVCIPTTRTILELEKVSHVVLRGLTLECAEGTVVTLKETENCLIAGCEIRNAGDYHGSGVSIAGGRKNGVVGCDIHHIGSNGISINGGDRKTLTASENYADNNYLHHFGHFYKQGVGIALGGVGNRASHNLIHDGPRMGIMFSGNNLVIEYNHIRHVNLETEDTGAVYTGGRDWISSRGTVIRHNYFHDILGYGKDAQGRWHSPRFAWGVYLDDNTGGVDVIGNVVARCSRAGIHLHNGRDNRIVNNMFLENGQQQFEYNGWKSTDRPWKDHFSTMVQGYESVADQPAWKQMRHMELHPRDAVLSDGTIMAGNVFERNIAAWKNPDAKLLSMRNVSFEQNTFDKNLYWHFGTPMETGFRAYGKTLSRNLAPNPGFEKEAANQMPADWNWQVRPLPTAKAEAVSTMPANGSRCLRIDAAFNTEKPRDNFPIIVSKDLELKPGAAYRLQARFRGTEPMAKAQLMLQSYVPQAYFWASSPNSLQLTETWKLAEFTFRVPAPGDSNYHAEMKKFRIRIDFSEKTGSLFVDDVVLQEVAMLSDFEAWQKQGNDEHSLVADPQFVDYDADDFRLKETSPAFKLGFQPIPIEKIGPYQDELRASWPIVEAKGAREKPLRSSTGASGSRN